MMFATPLHLAPNFPSGGMQYWRVRGEFVLMMNHAITYVFCLPCAPIPDMGISMRLLQLRLMNWQPSEGGALASKKP